MYRKIIYDLALTYNNPKYFETDPIIFPKRFSDLYQNGKANIQDIEIAGIIAAHLAWGRRDMIVRDCNRALEEMNWRPYDYISNGEFKMGKESLHRTISWNDFHNICSNLAKYYQNNNSLEGLKTSEIRTLIYGQKQELENNRAANKKIRMFKRWMVRNDGVVDLGIWKNSSPADLIIPVDVHVHRSAIRMNITSRRSIDHKTATDITNYLKTIFPDDPCLGDFALFAYAATKKDKADDGAKL